MLDQCWASVVDGGPTLVQHWVDVSCLLGIPLYISLLGKQWVNVLFLGEKYNIFRENAELANL